MDINAVHLSLVGSRSIPVIECNHANVMASGLQATRNRVNLLRRTAELQLGVIEWRDKKNPHAFD
jgi:hypothetical protein